MNIRIEEYDEYVKDFSVDGQYHEFNFDAEVNDDGQIVLHFRPEVN